MASSMASLFAKSQSLINLRFPETTRSNPLPGRTAAPLRRVPNRISGPRCGLIEPDGGKLVELVVPAGPEREARRREVSPAGGLPRIKLSGIDLEWVHVLSEGWASPLRGFMRETEFLQTLHFNCLRMHDGSVVNMSVPIVLAIDDQEKRATEGRDRVVLVDANSRPVAILKEATIFEDVVGVKAERGNSVVDRIGFHGWWHHMPAAEARTKNPKEGDFGES